ncbi:MAG: hypothetical protein N2323_06890 [candidate division WOR-3 bacterium]|nr:hypothetical protein [candidate division WOR-3 bacterium]MCX7837650.1 hypothetical protein [candidate division WOR-3 bacterium]MDW8114712.1 hypothetical protein [candidate division WOR-3 bacterium]
MANKIRKCSFDFCWNYQGLIFGYYYQKGLTNYLGNENMRFKNLIKKKGGI